MQLREIKVIICAKTINPAHDTAVKIQNQIDDLSGIFYIPALLGNNGCLSFDKENERLPWFPREYLKPMLEPKLAVGEADDVDVFISDYLGQMHGIESWGDYVAYFQKFYEFVTKSDFTAKQVRNLDTRDSFYDLDPHIYIFIDQTVFSTYHILSLYNELNEIWQNPEDRQCCQPLYENFLSVQITQTIPRIEDSASEMLNYCGQMNGNAFNVAT